MSELRLVLSERFDNDAGNAIRDALMEHLSVSEPMFRFQKSFDVTVVSVIELIGGVAAWLPLSAAATVYLSTLAK